MICASPALNWMILLSFQAEKNTASPPCLVYQPICFPFYPSIVIANHFSFLSWTNLSARQLDLQSSLKKCIVLILKLNYTGALMISSMHTCMQKIPGLNEQLFYAKERLSSRNLEGTNNELDTSLAGQAPAFPSKSGICC